jgi:hypothetical protein
MKIGSKSLFYDLLEAFVLFHGQSFSLPIQFLFQHNRNSPTFHGTEPTSCKAYISMLLSQCAYGNGAPLGRGFESIEGVEKNVISGSVKSKALTGTVLF